MDNFRRIPIDVVALAVQTYLDLRVENWCIDLFCMNSDGDQITAGVDHVAAEPNFMRVQFASLDVLLNLWVPL